MQPRVEFLSIYRFQSDYKIIDYDNVKDYRVRVDEPEGKVLNQNIPAHCLDALREYRKRETRLKCLF